MTTMVASQFTVTRQRQYPDGTLCVEISQGGFDFSNPGMLGIKYRRDGEGETFTGMTDAVKAAIAVYKKWKSTTEDEIGIAIGYTGGNTLPFDGQPLTDELEAEMLEHAAEFDKSLERCAQCGEIITGDKYGMHWMHHSEFDCCSDNCAEVHYAADEEQEPEDEDEEEE